MCHRQFLFLTLASCTLLGSGCGGSNGYYPVAGKVLHHGEPARGATVYFYAQEQTDPMHEHVPQGVVGDDGSFTLASPAGAGARPGSYAVLIEWKKDAGLLRGRGPGLNSPDRFKGRFMDPKRPAFRAEVKPEKNQLPPFELQ
jgi:hypothetical protein